MKEGVKVPFLLQKVDVKAEPVTDLHFAAGKAARSDTKEIPENLPGIIMQSLLC